MGMKTSLSDHRDVQEIDLRRRLQPFVITGLPRSRTAWLANLFTTDTTICYHDRPFTLDLADSGKVVGFSGPQLCLQFDEIVRFYPTAPWLIVLRDQDEARKATAEFTEIPDEWWQSRCHLIYDLCAKWQSQTVNYVELDDAKAMRTVWAHLLPGIPFDEERFNLLKNLSVQQRIPQV